MIMIMTTNIFSQEATSLSGGFRLVLSNNFTTAVSVLTITIFAWDKIEFRLCDKK